MQEQQIAADIFWTAILRIKIPFIGAGYYNRRIFRLLLMAMHKEPVEKVSMINKNIAKVIATVGVIALMITGPAAAQKGRWASAEDPVAKEMIVKERMWANSGCSPQPGLNDVFAEEFQGTAPNGNRYGKAKAIETDLKNPHRQCRLGEVKIQFFGEMLAVAYGNESSIYRDKNGKDNVQCLAWTDTWLKREGKWQIIAAQDGVVECKK